jgi:hypothetical protein
MGCGRYFHVIVAILAAGLQTGLARAEQSLHEQPIGTVVEGSFVLAGKMVVLPEGKFKLVHSGVRATTLLPQARIRSTAADVAEVVLYKGDGPTLQTVVRAGANVGTKARWYDEPCKRENFLYRLDRANSHNWVADCFTVDYQMTLMARPEGIWAEIYNEMKRDGVNLPLPLVLVAKFTRIFQEELLTVTYYINPAYYGVAPDGGPNWAASPWHKTRIESDAEKAAFVRSVGDWGTRMLPLVGAGFEGKNPLRQGAGAPAMDFARAGRGSPAKQ